MTPTFFWIIASIIALLSAAPLALALRRARGLGDLDTSSAEMEIQLYKDQLAEVDRDLARGVLTEESAKRSRIEISRRLLEADKSRAADKGAARKAPIWGALLLGAVVLGAAGGMYYVMGAPSYPDLPLERRLQNAQENRANRPSQTEMEAALPARPVQGEPSHIELVEKLRTALKLRGDDLEGYNLLVRNEAAIGNLTGAYQAQQRIIEIKGDAATATDYAILADFMIQATEGRVSPEAEEALRQTLVREPDNGTALFYSGLMFAQTGRPDTAFQLWSPLLSRSQPGDPWIAPIRSQIEAVASAAGIRYTLPPVSGSAPLSGPSAEDMEAAADMTPEERQEMIRGMVEGLSARLANEGGSPEEWSRLIGALGVLGETDRARAIWNEAQVNFGANPEVLDIIRQGAVRAGIAQ